MIGRQCASPQRNASWPSGCATQLVKASAHRYTPLLALLALPNLWLHAACGKVIFAAADLGAAVLIRTHVLSGGGSSGRTSAARHREAALAAALWLFNPYTATISTRGSGDAIVVLLQLLVLVLLQSPAAPGLAPSRLPLRKLAAGGAVFGLLVHWRLFPVVYGPSLVAHLAHRARQVWRVAQLTPLVRGTFLDPAMAQLEPPPRYNDCSRGLRAYSDT